MRGIRSVSLVAQSLKILDLKQEVIVKMLIRILTLFVVIFFSTIYGETILPVLRIENAYNSLFCGEPIMLKCWLINRNNTNVKVWDIISQSLIQSGLIHFNLITPTADTINYRIGIKSHMINTPTFVIPPKDSLYWYTALNWNNFLNNGNHSIKPGDYIIYAIYSYKRSDSLDLHFPYIPLKSNTITLVCTNLPDSERSIWNEWIPLTNEYYNWGERFRGSWVRKDYNDLCKKIAYKKSRFAIYAHFIYCKTTGDTTETRKFTNIYNQTSFNEILEFIINRDAAKLKYPCNVYSH